MGLRSFALVIDDVSRAGVNHGSRLMYFDLTPIPIYINIYR